MIRRRLMEVLKGMELRRHKLVDLPREMNLSEILTEYPIPLEYDSCLVILSCHGENVATQGTQTRNNNLFFVTNGTSLYMISAFVNSLISADEARNSGAMTWGGSNSSYFTVLNGKITASSLTNKTAYYAKENSLYYAAIPYDLKLGDFVS